MADDVKELMKSKSFRHIEINNDECFESYVNNDTSIAFNKEKHEVAIADYENWRFMVLDAEMLKLLYDSCNMKGWFDDIQGN